MLTVGRVGKNFEDGPGAPCGAICPHLKNRPQKSRKRKETKERTRGKKTDLNNMHAAFNYPFEANVANPAGPFGVHGITFPPPNSGRAPCPLAHSAPPKKKKQSPPAAKPRPKTQPARPREKKSTAGPRAKMEAEDADGRAHWERFRDGGISHFF